MRSGSTAGDSRPRVRRHIQRDTTSPRGNLPVSADAMCALSTQHAPSPHSKHQTCQSTAELMLAPGPGMRRCGWVDAWRRVVGVWVGVECGWRGAGGCGGSHLDVEHVSLATIVSTRPGHHHRRCDTYVAFFRGLDEQRDEGPRAHRRVAECGAHHCGAR